MPNVPVSRKATLYVTRGLPASGKSTWASKKVKEATPGTMVVLNKDDLRAMHHGFWAGNDTENQILVSRDNLVIAHLSKGSDVIVADTNLHNAHINKLFALAWELGANFELVDFFDVSIEECIRRDALRGTAMVGEEVIRRMAKQLPGAQKYKLPTAAPIEKVYPIDGLPGAVLCDIDGTMAHMVDRGPHEYHRVGEDAPDAAVVSLIQALLAAGKTVIAFSGRTETCREQTNQWIVDHIGCELPLYMRRAGDMRRDSYVKRDMFFEHIYNRYNVDFVLDDRDQVVRMWRTMGLGVYQVALGDF